MVEIVKQRARAIVRVGFPWWMRPFLLRDVIALTIGRRIWISPRVRNVEPLIRHELAHVRQMAQLGVLPFLWKYLREYLRNRRRGMSHHQAYLAISFEIEAVAAERENGVAG
ncbi:MAG: hypothetical protein AABO58_05515 [Acidobacteriota bacterium]